jgi:hypothetical protein
MYGVFFSSACHHRRQVGRLLDSSQIVASINSLVPKTFESNFRRHFRRNLRENCCRRFRGHIRRMFRGNFVGAFLG